MSTTPNSNFDVERNGLPAGALQGDCSSPVSSIRETATSTNGFRIRIAVWVNNHRTGTFALCVLTGMVTGVILPGALVGVIVGTILIVACSRTCKIKEAEASEHHTISETISEEARGAEGTESAPASGVDTEHTEEPAKEPVAEQNAEGPRALTRSEEVASKESAEKAGQGKKASEGKSALHPRFQSPELVTLENAFFDLLMRRHNTIAKFCLAREKLAARETDWFADDVIRQVVTTSMIWDHGPPRISDAGNEELAMLYREQEKGNTELFARPKIEGYRKEYEDLTREIEGVLARRRELLERNTEM
ncbi:MAG: hypothetical protein OXF02_06570 [Simkaniaceae bacterium]|nr:hypothetical protein [Simkaniaceae bacterium]